MMRLWLGPTLGKRFKYYHTTTQQTTNNALLNSDKVCPNSPQTARKGVVSQSQSTIHGKRGALFFVFGG